VNERGIVPGVKIGAHILDDCDKDTYGLEMAVDFIKGTYSSRFFVKTCDIPRISAMLGSLRCRCENLSRLSFSRRFLIPAII